MAPVLTPYSNDGYVFCKHKQLLLIYLLLCHPCVQNISSFSRTHDSIALINKRYFIFVLWSHSLIFRSFSVQLDKIPLYAKYLSSIGVDAVLSEYLYMLSVVNCHNPRSLYKRSYLYRTVTVQSWALYLTKQLSYVMMKGKDVKLSIYIMCPQGLWTQQFNMEWGLNSVGGFLVFFSPSRWMPEYVLGQKCSTVCISYTSTFWSMEHIYIHTHTPCISFRYWRHYFTSHIHT